MIPTEKVEEKNLEYLENRFFKSYVDIGITKAQEGYSTLENYSPAMASLVDVAVTKAQEWSPELIQDGVEYLDELLEAALERSKELKGKLTRDDVVKLIDQLKSEASQAQSQISGKIIAYLPSASIQEYELKENVNEILSKVLSQPQIIKDKASGLANDLHSNLDTDKDGKISVKDLCVNAIEVTQSATGYVSTAFETVSNSVISKLPKDVLSSPRLEEFVLPLAAPYLDSIKTQWKRKEAIIDVFLPLWSAIEVLKMYVNLYAANVQSKFDPLSPYLMKLLGNTSVMNLPLEIVQILKAASGLVSDKERDAVVKETRALFWALIDISFIIEILKEEKNDTKENKNDTKEDKNDTKPKHNTEEAELVELLTDGLNNLQLDDEKRFTFEEKLLWWEGKVDQVCKQ